MTIDKILDTLKVEGSDRDFILMMRDIVRMSRPGTKMDVEVVEDMFNLKVFHNDITTHVVGGTIVPGDEVLCLYQTMKRLLTQMVGHSIDQEYKKALICPMKR